jgi:hypothetical protein
MELYLAIQSQMENELLVSKEYYLLSARIFTMLSLNEDNRKMNGMDFFEEIYSAYINLIQKSMVIVKKIHDKLLSIDDMIVIRRNRDLNIMSLTAKPRTFTGFNIDRDQLHNLSFVSRKELSREKISTDEDIENKEDPNIDMFYSNTV